MAGEQVIAVFALALTLGIAQSADSSASQTKPMGTFDDGGGDPNLRSLKSVGIRGTIDAGGYAASATVKTKTEFFDQLIRLQLVALRPLLTTDGLCSAANDSRRAVVAQLVRGDYPTVVTALELLLRNTQDAGLHQLLGLAYEGSGQLTAAAEQFSATASSETNGSAAAVAYTAALLLGGEVDRALMISRAATEKSPPGGSLAQLGLGAALFQHGDLGQAIDLFGNLAMAHPGEKLPFEFLAVALRSADKSVLASSTNLLRRLTQGSENGSAHYALACALTMEDSGDTADPAKTNRTVEEQLKEAIRLDSSLADAHLRLGALYAGRGDIPNAIAEYEASLKADPARVESHYRLGQAYARCKKSQEAKQELATYEQLRAKQKSDVENGRVPIGLAMSATIHCP